MKMFFSFYLSLCVMLCYSQNKQSNNTVDTLNLKKDLTKITQTQKSRNYTNVATLDSVANYIKTELLKVCDSTAFQEYQVDTKIYRNVIGSLGPKDEERIIIGAHYDVYGKQEGADDNASGVSGLLELARLLSKEKLNYRIDFVAYTLEEPPFFRTNAMGSYVHANYLSKNKIKVKGMICLEMIGYYNEKENTQNYPINGMEMLYGTRANFITVVQNEKSGVFGSQMQDLMKKQTLIPTVAFNGSAKVRGVDYSDHLNYWNLNYPAVMITNTSFFRNKNYHTNKDTLETLDIQKMSAVIQQLYISIKQLK